VADVVADGKTRVYWVTTISNQNAPTTTELNAGMDLTSTLTADGLNGFQPDTAPVDTSSLASTFTSNVNGRTSFSGPKLRLKKQASGDTIFTTLVRDTAGFLVIRRTIAQATAWASSQAIEVYPALIGEVARMDPEPNTVERYELPVMITAGAAGTGPSMRAAVA
jgi:pyruvate carboxylase